MRRSQMTILHTALVAAIALTTISWSYAKNGPPSSQPSSQPTSQPAGKPSPATQPNKSSLVVPDPRQVGGESDGVVQVANLIYAGTKSSQCFSDYFLAQAEKDSAISTSRRFHAVKLASEEVFNFPLVIMTGEGAFTLSDDECKNLQHYIERGGFLLASSGCSSKEWDQSFRQEMARVFSNHSLQGIGMEHQVFHTVYDITELKAKHGTPQLLQGISFNGRLGVLYSQDGLNDTQHATGCCCCGGNEITNAIDINVNILAYALVY